MNNKVVLFGVAGLLGVGAAVALFAGSGPSEDPGTSSHTTSSTTTGSQPVVTNTGGSELSEEPVAEGAKKTAEKKKTKPGQDVEAYNKQMNEGFGLHARNAAPTWNRLAFRLNEEGLEELGAECKTLGQELGKEMRNTEADVPAWIERERELMARINASPAANTVADELRKLDEMLVELEGA